MEMMSACLSSFILGAIVAWVSQAISARQARKQLEITMKHKTEAKVETKKKETT